VVRFAVDPARIAPVIVDTQNVFVADSPRAAPQGAQVAGRLNWFAAACRRAGIPVIWTRQVLRPKGINTGLLGQLVPPVVGGVINDGAPLAALHPLVDIRPGDGVVGRPRFGSFYGTGLKVLLRSRGIDTIILGGINTTVCVDTTAREVAVHEFRTVPALAAGRRGVLAVVQERDGSPTGMGWHLMPWVEQRALPGPVPRHKTEPGNSPGRSMCWLATGRHDDAVTVAAP